MCVPALDTNLGDSKKINAELKISIFSRLFVRNLRNLSNFTDISNYKCSFMIISFRILFLLLVCVFPISTGRYPILSQLELSVILLTTDTTTINI